MLFDEMTKRYYNKLYEIKSLSTIKLTFSFCVKGLKYAYVSISNRIHFLFIPCIRLYIITLQLVYQYFAKSKWFKEVQLQHTKEKHFAFGITSSW